MWFFLFLFHCCVGGLDCITSPTPNELVLTPTPEPGVRNGLSSGKLEPPTAKPLEDEQNQVTIRQLLGDDDKVRTVSSGSDCVCRCIVRPISLPQGSQETTEQTGVQQESYTVTIETSGSDCRRCECTAPLSVVRPCEGEYCPKQLMLTEDDVRMDCNNDLLLEGSPHGRKLQSVTTNLLSRVDYMLAVTCHFNSRVKEYTKEKAEEKSKKSQQKKKKTNILKLGDDKGQRNARTINTQAQWLDINERQLTTMNKTKAVKVETKESIKDKSSKVIRGWTFYMAEGARLPVEKERQKTLSLLADVQVSDGRSVTIHSQVSPVVPTKPDMMRYTQHPSATSTAATEHAKTTAQSHVQQTTEQPTTVPSPTVTARQAEARSRLGWTESPDQQPKPTTKPAMCKDTVASISEPVLHNRFGLSDGIWMKDARGHGNVIYLTNGHYGNELLEFRDMTTFKLGKVSNSYKLPYSYTGTSHVVFNGALYYNRAFSRDVIRYDLRQRYVSAWTTLHDAILEEQSHRTRTEVEFAVDESGIWLIYPALDTEGFHQEVILLNHVRSRDLQTIRSFRTGLRRGYYGNTFLVCGVLYGVDSMNRHHANVTYAFDTHTLTHTVPNLAFINTHSHTAQLSYCPLDKKLYAWDNGHQMTYDIVFAY
ncbi:LOW QUALITY PROTEIN: olfactomedin-like protein 2B [Neosynchiropus ocellatus]